MCDLSLELAFVDTSNLEAMVQTIKITIVVQRWLVETHPWQESVMSGDIAYRTRFCPVKKSRRLYPMKSQDMVYARFQVRGS